MTDFKKQLKRKNQLKTNSNLFFQLGIILTLAILYTLFETQVSTNVKTLANVIVDEGDPELYVLPSFEIEPKKAPKEVSDQKITKPLTDFVIDNDKSDVKNEFILKNKPQKKINLDSLFSDVPDIKEGEPESIPFIIIEQAPRFPGCKGNNENEYKACFNKKIKAFVAKKFNPTIQSSLKGKQKIIVLFEINKNGDVVNIKARSPHKNLEKAAVKAVRKLPQMEPGKQRNQAVGVKYTLPISIILN